ncbi:9046_t:CDS:2 [Funneliformis caledonium]|uniref:9046_t:CDS:1 n=1 Tax=Funneliformis caledonium TaxID=1117310 RepID=A0A9N9D6G7_9GLOM|nr:9046_t:CDS:2 [Funneliformis caledonium]
MTIKKLSMKNDESIESNNIYFEVENIVNHYTETNGAFRYLLKWKGYNEEDNSWVNEEDISAPSLIRLYWSNKNNFNRKRYLPKKGAIRTNRDRRSSRKAKYHFDNQQESDSSTIQEASVSSDKNTTGNSDEISKLLQSDNEKSESTYYYFTFDNWEKYATILNVVRNDTKIFVHIQWPDGTENHVISSEVYQRCPLKLIQYYERQLCIHKKGDE